jgi:hypothetical protein
MKKILLSVVLLTVLILRSYSQLPASPVLVEPPNITNCVTVVVTLNWTDAQGAEYYDIQISTESDFSTTIPWVVPQSYISELTIPQGALSTNTVYYWRVRSINYSGASDFSTAFCFKTLGTSVEEIGNLSGEVDALVINSSLPTNQGEILKNRLNSAQQQIELNHNFYAAFQLTLFKVRVYILDYSNMLSHSDAQALIQHADVIISELNLGFAVLPPETNVPEEFKLNQNYPNPFNPATTIEYTIPKSSNVSLKIYDISGREVASLVDKYQDAGTFIVNWNASNFSSGIYIYRLTAGNYTDTKKMILNK